jgi:hypothetical protein
MVGPQPRDCASVVIRTLRAAHISACIFGGLAIRELFAWESAFGRPRVTLDTDIIINTRDVRIAMGPLETIDAVPAPGSWLTSDGRFGRSRWRGTCIDCFSNPLRLNQDILIPGECFSSRILSAGMLLLTKLQIHQKSEQDWLDVLAILHRLGESSDTSQKDVIDIVAACSENWTLEQAVIKGLETSTHLTRQRMDTSRARRVDLVIVGIRRAIARSEKSFGWKLRSRAGRALPMYNTTST